METLTLRKPDDWHCHLRDGAMLKAVAPFTAKRFGRAIAMPNLAPNPVTTTEALLAYKERILAVTGSGFTPLMTYYLTDESDADMIVDGFTAGHAAAVKIYPAHATTNSAQGVTGITKVYPVLTAMEAVGMPVLMHGEVVRDENGNDIAPADREKVFLETRLPKLLTDFPTLKIVLEHATTKEAVQFVIDEDSPRLGATITAHHLYLSSDDVIEEHLKSYAYCLPVVKSRAHVEAVRKAVTSGSSHFFLGTDSAPHPTVKKDQKEGYPGGVFTAPAALELYAQVFEEEGALQHFEAFASLNGPRFYGMEPNAETITLVKEPWTIDSLVDVEDGTKVRPFGYHEDPAKRFQIQWKLAP